MAIELRWNSRARGSETSTVQHGMSAGLLRAWQKIATAPPNPSMCQTS